MTGRKQRSIGILAPVDSGKTTLIESMLYLTGAIRRQGRVDHGGALLDHDRIERARGITIYAKSVHYRYGDADDYILDTPGHMDFAPEMARTLSAMDAAILVIHAFDGLREDFGACRSLLIDFLADYGGYVDEHIIIVFDAYRMKHPQAHVEAVAGVTISYTAQRETAEQFREEVMAQRESGRAHLKRDENILTRTVLDAVDIREETGHE